LFSTGFVSRLASQVDLLSFEEQLPSEFFKLLGADEETRVETAAELLEKLNDFGKKGAALAAEAARKELKEDLKRKLAAMESAPRGDDFDDM
jgi:hypothetical protein